ncbi:unnamed protein product [Schistosoma mattheei]|uniref:Uncharacterized protein n=1 Tax=Schistosoma mattheei TaxID=31246 RepID=A0A3P8DWP7_9TREM|nr:unnamed protein product [Schistosoma mattheei]
MDNQITYAVHLNLKLKNCGKFVQIHIASVDLIHFCFQVKLILIEPDNVQMVYVMNQANERANHFHLVKQEQLINDPKTQHFDYHSHQTNHCYPVLIGQTMMFDKVYE